MKSKLELGAYVLGLRLFRSLGHPKLGPINVTVSVTNKCNSRCRTCFIWQNQGSSNNKELTADEFARIFESLGRSPYWFTMSGGEPFLRTDLPEICEAAVKYCQPSIINIPSNGLLPAVTEDSVKKIVEILERTGETTLIVNLSLDDLGTKHDMIRGIQGNFDTLVDTYKRLEKIRSMHSCLRLGIHSVVSRFNVDSLPQLYEYVKTLRPDSYITEIAEERSELFNTGKAIEPTPEDYRKYIEELSRKVQDDFGQSGYLSKITQSYRTAYYRIVSKWLEERRQIIPCYAAYASCQITSMGEVWPCCVLGYEKPLGNLRETEYDFKFIWQSKRADEVRSLIKKKGCSCPLANAHYTNMLCNVPITARIMRQILRPGLEESVIIRHKHGARMTC